MSIANLASKYMQGNPLPAALNTDLTQNGVIARWQLLHDARTRCAYLMDSIDLTGYDAATAIASVNSVSQKLDSSAGSWLPLSFNQILNPTDGLSISDATLRDVIKHAFDNAEGGFPAHDPVMAQKLLLDGVMSGLDLKNDCLSRYRTYDFILFCDQNKALDNIKIGSTPSSNTGVMVAGTNGLGLGPVAIIILVVLAIAIIVGIAYYCTGYAQTANTNEMLKGQFDKYCVSTSPSYDATACSSVQKMQSAASSTTASQWTDIVNKLPVYLMVAAGAYFVGQLMIAKAGRTVIQTK